MADKKRLIDANALIATMKEMYCDGCKSHNGVRCRACDFDCCMSDIDNAPTVDAVEVVHGQWIGEADGYADGELVYDVWYCSECNFCIDNGTDDPELLPNYCERCGAKMDKEVANEP